MKTITLRQLRYHWPLYLLILPALAFILTFSYFPATSAVYHSFFDWDGDEQEEFIGLANFVRALQDAKLAAGFQTVLILIFANLFKMIPSIITAVMIHRMISEKWRYIYRVLFVIPMIIPMMVWLLLWKFFYDPTFGPLNRFLNATGLMNALEWLDGRMPALAAAVAPVRDTLLNPLFGGVWGALAAGAAFLILRARARTPHRQTRALAVRVLLCLALGAIATGLAGALVVRATGADPARDLLAPAAAMAALAVIIAAVLLLRRYRTATEAFKWIGLALLAVAVLFMLTSMIWTAPTRAFTYDKPAWLGHRDLILPAFIFWGFPWVGVVSVLLYLSGLGNIDQSVYDAAEIDGCGWFRKFWNIELPLITTQVRLNLILMCIGTLKGWGLIFILFTDTGGPEGRLMVPGLYMFRKAFTDAEAGYACAIGFLLFLLILTLTVINNRYVRVQK